MTAQRTTDETGGRSEGMGKALKRRGLIAGAAALVAGVVAKQTSQPVTANTLDDRFTALSDGGVAFDTLPLGRTTFYDIGVRAQGLVQGVYGLGATSTSGIGVQGDGTGSAVGVLGNGGGNGAPGVQGNGGGSDVGVYGTAGGVNAAGVYGTSSGATGFGVGGLGSGANGTGVSGVGNGNGAGVVGRGPNTGVQGNGAGDTSGNTTGFPIGVRGSVPNSGYGVYGNAGIGAGVHGNAAGGAGVDGAATTGTGAQGISTSGTGVFGQSSGNSVSKGVYGHHTTNGFGVYGDAGTGGYGVTGVATTAYGVVGVSTSGTGTLGQIPPASSAANTIGVYGQNYSTGSGGIGVRGQIPGTLAAGTIAVYGENMSGSTGGFPGNGGFGCYGFSAKGHGLVGATGTAGGGALVGSTNGIAGAYAGIFYGPIAIVGAAKSAAVKNADGSHSLLYCEESPESWFADYGKGTLANGQATVKIDPAFAAVADLSDYHIFLTTYGASQGLDVMHHDAGGFVVQERNKGTGNSQFSYRIVGKRKDIEGKRLAKVHLPPEPTRDGIAAAPETPVVTPPSAPAPVPPVPAPSPETPPGSASPPAVVPPVPAVQPAPNPLPPPRP